MSGPKDLKRKIFQYYSKFFFISAILVRFLVHKELCIRIYLNNILIQKSQQDENVTEFTLSDDCSTCFGYHYHPSSGADFFCLFGINKFNMGLLYYIINLIFK